MKDFLIVDQKNNVVVHRTLMTFQNSEHVITAVSVKTATAEHKVQTGLALKIRNVYIMILQVVVRVIQSIPIVGLKKDADHLTPILTTNWIYLKNALEVAFVKKVIASHQTESALKYQTAHFL